MPDRLRAARGDLARLALEAKLVDALATRDAVRQRLIALVGEDKKTPPDHPAASRHSRAPSTLLPSAGDPPG